MDLEWWQTIRDSRKSHPFSFFQVNSFKALILRLSIVLPYFQAFCVCLVYIIFNWLKQEGILFNKKEEEEEHRAVWNFISCHLKYFVSALLS